MASFINKVLKCPFCNTSSTSIVLKKDKNNFLYCTSCKTTFQQNERDNFFSFFKSEYKIENKFLSEEEITSYTNANFKSLFFNDIESNLKSVLKKCSAKIIVDIGCGGGWHEHLFKGLYEEYYGFEPSQIPNEQIINRSYLSKNITLLHYDSTKLLPIHNESGDVVTFLASYDHIFHIEDVIKDIYNKLKYNGYLIILMINYSFWLKRFINKITGRKLFRHRNGHYRVHSPDSLIKEIKSFVNIRIESVKADSIFLPRLPRQFRFIYFNKKIIIFMNSLLKYIFSLLHRKNYGSYMIVVFKKSGIKGISKI